MGKVLLVYFSGKKICSGCSRHSSCSINNLLYLLNFNFWTNFRFTGRYETYAWRPLFTLHLVSSDLISCISITQRQNRETEMGTVLRASSGFTSCTCICVCVCSLITCITFYNQHCQDTWLHCGHSECCLLKDMPRLSIESPWQPLICSPTL